MPLSRLRHRLATHNDKDCDGHDNDDFGDDKDEDNDDISLHGDINQHKSALVSINQHQSVSISINKLGSTLVALLTAKNYLLV